MKSQLLSIFAVGLLGTTAMFTSCNSDSSDELVEISYTSTQVKSFSLKANSKVLSGLDSVFFSIDLVNAQIFNADSLPYGTRINGLELNITTDACSAVELNVPLKNGKDTVVNYLTNSTDTIDFSNGPVRLHLVSYDGKAERDYTIRVNVHKMVPDSLCWDRMAQRTLPTQIASPKAQKTVKYGDAAYCLTTDGSAYNIAISNDPYNDSWQVRSVNFGFTPDVSSFTATSSALYILSSTGELYSSADGLGWTATSQTWSHIYGAYLDRLLGLKQTDGGFAQVTYPATVETVAPEDFPVSATGNLNMLSTRWADNPQVVMLGGRLASGKLTNALWGYDGKRWAKLAATFPKPISKVAIFDYKISETDTLTWRTREYPVMIAMCGEEADSLNTRVYVSKNSGLDWKQGDELIQLPPYVAPRADAQALVFATVSHSRSASQWREYAPVKLPRWWQRPASSTLIMSRATHPVTEWDVPYIYLFGGNDAQGRLCNSIWRGVINRLTFKPLI